MEPWLGCRSVGVNEGRLILSTETEKLLSTLTETTRRFLDTMKDDFWHDPYVAALQYYFSIVPLISVAKAAYPFFCGKAVKGKTIAMSISLDPDYTTGLKEPLFRYAKAMPGIAATTPNFSTGAEYSLFIFCYRTLIAVLEELLLAVEGLDTVRAFAALYDVNTGFEELRLLFLKCGSKYDPDKKVLVELPTADQLEQAAGHCVDALRLAAREFYVLEMLIHKSCNRKLSKCTGPRGDNVNTDLKISKSELDEFAKNLLARRKELVRHMDDGSHGEDISNQLKR